MINHRGSHIYTVFLAALAILSMVTNAANATPLLRRTKPTKDPGKSHLDKVKLTHFGTTATGPALKAQGLGMTYRPPRKCRGSVPYSVASADLSLALYSIWRPAPTSVCLCGAPEDSRPSDCAQGLSHSN